MSAATSRLHEAILTAGVSVVSVSVGVHGDSSTVTVLPADLQDEAQATINAFDWSQAAQDAWQATQNGAVVILGRAVRLGANRQTSSNALSDVTGLSFSLKANTHYAFRFTGAYTAQAGTTGLSLAVNGPASPNLVRMVGQIHESATAVRGGATAAYDTALTGANSGGATPLPFWVEGNISTGASGGTLALRFASEVNGNQVTILAGSMGELKAVG